MRGTGPGPCSRPALVLTPCLVAMHQLANHLQCLEELHTHTGVYLTSLFFNLFTYTLTHGHSGHVEEEEVKRDQSKANLHESPQDT